MTGLPRDGDEGLPAVLLRLVVAQLQLGEMPASDDIEEIARALDRYNQGEVSSISEAFGFPWNTHLEAKKRELQACAIAWAVERIQSEARASGKRIPLESNVGTEGAYEVVGRRFNMAPATVKKYRDKYRAFRKGLGLSPDMRQQAATAEAAPDATVRIFAALHDSLRNDKKK